MGVDYTVYLGSFIKCKQVKKHKDVVKRNLCCPFEDCPKFGKNVVKSSKFCSDCGTPTKELNFTEKEEVPAWQLIPEWFDNSDRMYSHHFDGFTNYIPNVSFLDIERESFIHPKYEEKVIPITVDSLKETEEFTSFFKDEIDALIEVYGKENVEVQWGLVNYAS